MQKIYIVSKHNDYNKYYDTFSLCHEDFSDIIEVPAELFRNDNGNIVFRTIDYIVEERRIQIKLDI